MSAPPVSPAQLPPPIKKQRAGATPPTVAGGPPRYGGGAADRLSKDADNAINRRRAELDKLKNRFNQKRSTFSPAGAPPKGLSGLSASQPPPTMGQNLSFDNTGDRPPMPPQRQLEPRTSDIFPEVPKSASTNEDHSLAQLAAAASNIPSNTPVARRLDETLQKQLEPPKQAPPPRANSAPPVRPPPPPPKESLSQEAPPKMTPAPPRGFVGRPDVLTPHPPITQKGKLPPMPAAGPPLAFGAKETGAPPKPDPEPPMPAGEPPKASTAMPSEGPPKVSFFPSNATSQSKNVSISNASPTTMQVKEPVATEMEPESTALMTSAPPPTKENAGFTPFQQSKKDSRSDATPANASKPDVSEPPSTARRDALKTMHAIASSPVPKKGSISREEPPTTVPAAAPSNSSDKSADLRMQQELAQAQKDKAKALREKAQLEEELTKLKSQKASEPHVGFLSPLAPSSLPMSPGLKSPLPNMQSPRIRVPTPHPKRVGGAADAPQVIYGTDESLLPFLHEAAAHVPFEYESDTASFHVRRPYGVETNQHLWFSAGQMDPNLYHERANIDEAESIEIAALIPADSSKLVLFGSDSVRLGSRDGSWQDVPHDQGPLGSVTYIDSEANEREYCLDTIYESALSVRDLYCSSLLSMAVGLQQKQESEPPLRPESQAPPPMEMPMQAPKPPMADAAVNTDPMPKPQAVVPPPQKPPAPAPQKAAPPPPPAEEDNVMGIFLGMVVSFFWNVFVMMPLRVLLSVLTFGISIVLVALVWMYIANEHGALSLTGNAPPGQLFNPPGLF